MKPGHEILDMIEERFTGWSWDGLPRLLLYAFSRAPELPKEMEIQARALNTIVVKAEMLSIMRSALQRLTDREYKLKVQPPEGTVPGPLNFAPHDNAEGTVVPMLITEVKRLESELNNVSIDYLAILRFLRKALA